MQAVRAGSADREPVGVYHIVERHIGDAVVEELLAPDGDSAPDLSAVILSQLPELFRNRDHAYSPHF